MTFDTHKFYKDMSEADHPFEKPCGSIQWKGTGVCIDLHCECGHHGHVDDEFFYYYRCPSCGVLYHVGSMVKLVKLTPEQEEYVMRECSGTIKTDELRKDE